jgi:hypothetical protein
MCRCFLSDPTVTTFRTLDSAPFQIQRPIGIECWRRPVRDCVRFVFGNRGHNAQARSGREITILAQRYNGVAACSGDDRGLALSLDLAVRPPNWSQSCRWAGFFLGLSRSMWLTPRAVANSKTVTIVGLRFPFSRPLRYCWLKPEISANCS